MAISSPQVYNQLSTVINRAGGSDLPSLLKVILECIPHRYKAWRNVPFNRFAIHYTGSIKMLVFYTLSPELNIPGTREKFVKLTLHMNEKDSRRSKRWTPLTLSIYNNYSFPLICSLSLSRQSVTMDGFSQPLDPFIDLLRRISGEIEPDIGFPIGVVDEELAAWGKGNPFRASQWEQFF